MQQHVLLQPELCDVCLLRCLRLRLALVELSLQLGGSTFLNLELFFHLLNFLLSGHQFPARAILNMLGCVTARKDTEVLRSGKGDFAMVWKELCYGKTDTLGDAEEGSERVAV